MFESISAAAAALKTSLGASAVGALISVFFADKALGRVTRFAMAVAGFAISVYLTPHVMTFLEISAKYEPGVGFLTGMFGMSVMSRVASFIKHLDLNRLVDRWFGKKGD